MKIQKIRWTILIWNLLLILFGGFIVITTRFILFKNIKLSFNNPSFNCWIMIIILYVLCWGLFLSFLAVPFIFKNNIYPYVTGNENEFSFTFLNWLSYYKWIWLYLIPIITALICPIIMLILILTLSSEFYSEINILQIVIVIIIFSFLFAFNNIMFIWYIRRIKQNSIVNIKKDFIFKNE